MAIPSNLKSKDYRVEGGTTLIKLSTKETKDKRRFPLHLRKPSIKDEEELGKWVKTRVTSENLKELKKLAVDEEVSLAELLTRAITYYLKEGR